MSNNKQRIQILRAKKDFDISKSNETLLDGQPFYNGANNQLYIGNGTDTLQTLKPLNGYANQLVFTRDIRTSYNIGSIEGDSATRPTFIHEGDTLEDVFDLIFDPPIQPKVIQPSINLNVYVGSNTNNKTISGELGAPWQEDDINTSVTYNDGSYEYGSIQYITNDDGSVEKVHHEGTSTGITWSESPQMIKTVNTSGIFGNGKRTYKYINSYTAQNRVARDNKKKISNPEQKITSDTVDSDPIDISEAVKYRCFYGSIKQVQGSDGKWVDAIDVDNLLEGVLKTTNESIVDNSTDVKYTFKSELINSKTTLPTTFKPTCEVLQDGCMYLILAAHIPNINKIKNAITGIQVAFNPAVEKTYYNYYYDAETNKVATYKVYVYKASDRLNATTVQLQLQD